MISPVLATFSDLLAVLALATVLIAKTASSAARLAQLGAVELVTRCVSEGFG